MRKRIIRNNKIIISILLIISFISCDSKQIFDEYKSLENSTWNKEENISFEFKINDTISKQNLFINLRNNNDYPFRNLFLITNLTFPDGNKIIDTLEYDMADKTGKFLGEGFYEIKENKLFYKENIVFPIKGSYNFSVRQSMRKAGEISGIKSLKGITEVGFRIEEIK